ncbi:hypothetical protein E4U47_006576, partial [Claviceps purpurea]
FTELRISRMHNGPNNKAARVASRAQGNISSPQPEPSRTIAQEALYGSFASTSANGKQELMTCFVQVPILNDSEDEAQF